MKAEIVALQLQSAKVRWDFEFFCDLRPVQTGSTCIPYKHSTCILYKVESVWTPCIVPTIHDSTSLIVYSDVWNGSYFYSTTTRLFFCFAITEAILYLKSSSFERTTRQCRASACAVEVVSMETKSHTNKKLSKIRPQMAQQKEESGQIKKLIYWLTFWKTILVSGMSIAKSTTSELLGIELTRK